MMSASVTMSGGNWLSLVGPRTARLMLAPVSEISTSISGAVEEQSAATREVSSNISGVTQAADETGRSSATVLTVSQELAHQAAELEQRVDQFLVTVRAM